MSKAKQWLQTCIGGHTNCKEFHRSTINTPQQRPTRVLEITKSTIHLRCNMQNERFDYLVLSYMWGNNHKQQLRLLRSNLKDFQKEIPRAEFEASDVYKEAMRVTLALGYKYLWIDSLTIIQDSPEDWAHEARRMAIVYGNATANLAFLFPPHSPTKPSQRDDPRVWNPCVFRAPSSQTPGIYLEHTKSSFRRDYAPEEKAQDWLVQRSWPLFNRAWTFQEYLLAPRTLLLGHKNLMWQCSEGFYDEILGPITEVHATTLQDPKRGDRGKSRYFPETIHELSALRKKRGSLSEPAVLSFMMDWQNLVDEYRSRKLSFGKDRIIAFAGVARAFSNLGQLTYLAGLWWEIIPIALLWYVDKKMVPLVRRENGLQNGGLPSSVWTTEIEESVVQPELPSWSWFSVPIWRYYQLYFLFGDDELAVRCKSYSEPKLVCWDDVFWAEVKGFRFVGLERDRVPEGSLFDFSGLQVTIAALVLPVKADWPADLAAQMRWLQQHTASSSGSSFRWEPVLEYYPDDPAGRPSPPRNAIYALMAEFQVVRTAGKNNVQRRLVGLMLVPGSKEGMWRRVGVWKLRINVVDVHVSGENIAEVAKRWRKMSVMSNKWQHVLITLA
ncbi:HET-domain-containing protein [Alternaria alternata]|nr:HET-domain-containing protein [Alternaria alternata]